MVPWDPRSQSFDRTGCPGRNLFGGQVVGTFSNHLGFPNPVAGFGDSVVDLISIRNPPGFGKSKSAAVPEIAQTGLWRNFY